MPVPPEGETDLLAGARSLSQRAQQQAIANESAQAAQPASKPPAYAEAFIWLLILLKMGLLGCRVLHTVPKICNVHM